MMGAGVEGRLGHGPPVFGGVYSVASQVALGQLPLLVVAPAVATSVVVAPPVAASVAASPVGVESPGADLPPLPGMTSHPRRAPGWGKEPNPAGGAARANRASPRPTR